MPTYEEYQNARREAAEKALDTMVLRFYKSQYSLRHVSRCPEAYVAEYSGNEGTYGCDTGCEYTQLIATIKCPHNDEQEFEYGTFGDITHLVEQMIYEIDQQESNETNAALTKQTNQDIANADRLARGE